MKKASIIFLILAVVITIPFTISYFSKISIHNFVANDMRGNEVKFDEFKGKVLAEFEERNGVDLADFLDLEE